MHYVIYNPLVKYATVSVTKPMGLTGEKRHCCCPLPSSVKYNEVEGPEAHTEELRTLLHPTRPL